MTKEQKPEAIRLAEKLRDVIHLLDCDFADDIDTNDLSLAAMEIESLHARVQELKGQLEAVRAGGDSTDEVTVLPDGSAFAVYSYPLPKGHWLYAPREYEQGAEEPKELAAPILTHAAREQVISAIRYAVRGATDCGKETDFDPDALVQNAVYALCGPFNKNQPHPKTDARDEESEKLLRALYDRGYEDRAKERDYDPLGASEFDAAMCAGAARAKQADMRDAERYRWLRDEWLGNEPEAINMERARGQRGLDAAIDAAIAAAKGNK